MNEEKIIRKDKFKTSLFYTIFFGGIIFSIVYMFLTMSPTGVIHPSFIFIFMILGFMGGMKLYKKIKDLLGTE